jgi:hypothetical protein
VLSVFKAMVRPMKVISPAVDTLAILTEIPGSEVDREQSTDGLLVSRQDNRAKMVLQDRRAPGVQGRRGPRPSRYV